MQVSIQAGSDYAKARDFKAAFPDTLRKVHMLYAGANFEMGECRLIVEPTRPYITPRG